MTFGENEGSTASGHHSLNRLVNRVSAQDCIEKLRKLPFEPLSVVTLKYTRAKLDEGEWIIRRASEYKEAPEYVGIKIPRRVMVEYA
jgi:hypothetical protein